MNIIQRKEVLGYQLYDLGNDQWCIISNKDPFHGSLEQVTVFAVHVLGFSVKEIETAVLEMEKNFHNGSEFGVLKKFMWTFDKEERYHNLKIAN